MTTKSFKVIHDLSTLRDPKNPENLDVAAIQEYLAKVSEFIGLDPSLNGLDTIWMQNENGPGRSLVVYARRGTAEILRNVKGIDILSLTNQIINGSIVFTATGKDKIVGRQEIATGSKSIDKLVGKALDDAIMTASTRALRRVTMQFTSLGILDESEVVSIVGQDVNPAGSALPAANPTPPAFVTPSAPINNAPGKPVEPPKYPSAPASAAVSSFSTTFPGKVEDEIGLPKEKAVPNAAPAGTPLVAPTMATAPPVSYGEPFVGQQSHIDAAWQQIKEKEAAKKADISTDISEPEKPATPVESTVTPGQEGVKKADKPKRTRKPKNSVALDDVVPETVTSVPEKGTGVGNVAPSTLPPPPHTLSVPTQANPAVPPQANPAPVSVPASVPAQVNPAAPTQVNSAATPVAGMPNEEQMADYRKKIAVFTAQLPPSENMGSVQKMRAFITRMSGAAPQDMTVAQWDEMLVFFERFMKDNSIKNLVNYINTLLGVK